MNRIIVAWVVFTFANLSFDTSALAVLVATSLTDVSWAECLAAPKRTCVLAKVSGIVRADGNAANRSYYLVRIAVAQAKAKLAEQSASTFDEATKSAQSVPEENERAQALREIATLRAEFGKFDEAKAVAALIGTAEQRVSTFLAIGRAQRQAGLFDDAGQTFALARTGALSMKQRRMRESYLLAADTAAAETAALLQEQRGNATEAIRLARKIRDKISHQHAVSNILYRVVQKGGTAEALRLLQTLQDGDRVEALGTVLRASERWAQENKQVIDFKPFLEIAQTLQAPEDSAQAFLSIVKSQATAGMSTDAKTVFERSLTAARSIKSPEKRAQAIKEAALALGEFSAKLGFGEQADSAFDQALQAARLLKSDEDRAEALRSVAAAQMLVGRDQQTSQQVRARAVEKSRASFEEAIRAAEAISESSSRRPHILTMIAETDGLSHDAALRAVRLIKYFNCGGTFGGPIPAAPMPVLKSLSREELPAEALCALVVTHVVDAQAYTDAKALKEAEISLHKAQDAVTGVDEYMRGLAFADIAAGYAYLAKAQALAGQAKEAGASFEEALRVARSVGDLQRAFALNFIAKVQANVGLKDAAAQTFEDVLRAAKEWGQRGHHDQRYSSAVLLTQSQISAGLGVQAFTIFYRVFADEHNTNGISQWLAFVEVLPD